MAAVLTNVGKTYFANKGANTNNTSIANRIGWGTGAGTAAITDTTLFAESTEARVAGTQSVTTTTVTNDTYTNIGTLTSLSNQTITNAAVFDAATAGNMIEKADHAGIPTQTNDTVQYTFGLKFA